MLEQINDLVGLCIFGRRLRETFLPPNRLHLGSEFL